MPFHYVFIGPFEKDAVKSRRDWIAASRATLGLQEKYKIFTAFNEHLMRDHFLLLLFSNHSTRTDDEESSLLRDALGALQDHWEGKETPAGRSMYVLPSFDEQAVRGPTWGYIKHLKERAKVLILDLPST
ncbi:hypothetical protein P170DRAFT_477218 [Aspergillus steynii IBT 23096]|uniref:Uncharacterized protein n=1 Tax=Aspergillus steynii IBT 23096 TaxID=1392250 RepID=A0A2I2G0D8_9EURO|nr:uncharacterized protein P170DRAFT_477218 [Aspergillus steynii IBT 23096]PLB46339.1 hypothetical protein P170DRAFT_477218 [Aspergillus steynii IBT 23096]